MMWGTCMKTYINTATLSSICGHVFRPTTLMTIHGENLVESDPYNGQVEGKHADVCRVIPIQVSLYQVHSFMDTALKLQEWDLFVHRFSMPKIWNREVDTLGTHCATRNKKGLDRHPSESKDHCFNELSTKTIVCSRGLQSNNSRELLILWMVGFSFRVVVLE